MSPDWLVNKGATVNPKIEKDNKCFLWSIISGLSYDKIKEKDLKKNTKTKGLIQIFHYTVKIGKGLDKTIPQLLLICYFHPTIMKK